MKKNHWQHFKYRSLWQHPLWADFQHSAGRKVWILETDRAYALIVRHPLPFGLSWLEVPRGPLVRDGRSLPVIIDKLYEFGIKENAVFIRMSSYKTIEIKDTRYDHHPETSLILDLNLSESDILKQMKSKGRYNIKVAEKHGVMVYPSDDVNAFYELLSKTSNRDGFSVHPKNYYEKMLNSFGKHAQLLLAEYEGRVIAGGIFVYLDEWGIYYYGASDHHYRNLMAPYLIQWSAIQEAKKRGCKYYDFLGISPENAKNHAWAGVTSFKKKFGGKTVNYPRAQDMVLRRFWYFVYKVRKVFG